VDAEALNQGAFASLINGGGLRGKKSPRRLPMSLSHEKHDALVNNVAKLATIAVIALGLALIIAVFVYTV
jgi:hypothetical protein